MARQSPSVSSIVRQTLDENPTLVHALQRREKSQREVAKTLISKMKELNSELPDWPKEGAVTVAITRYLKKMREKQDFSLGTQQVERILTGGTTEIDDGLRNYRINLPNNENSNELIVSLFKKVQTGDLHLLCVDSYGCKIYVKKLKEDAIINEIKKTHNDNLIKIRDNLSLLTLILPLEASGIPGILAHVSSLLANQAISIYDVLVQYQENFRLAFVITEKDVMEGRKVLRKVIEDNSEFSS